MTVALALDAGLPPGLVDPRTGIIRRLEQPPLPADFPPAFRLVSAVLSDSRVFSPWPSDPVTAGCAFEHVHPALDAAIGEAVERYCGNIVRSALRKTSYAALRVAGAVAVDPAALALYSPGQYADPAFAYVPFDRELPVQWTRGRELPSGAPAWVPASLVWVTYTETGELPDEPRTNGTVPAGIAAGPTRTDAELSALLEVVERDALVLAWSCRQPLAEVAVPPWLRELAVDPARHLRLRCFDVPNELGLSVRAVLVRDAERGLLTLGSACRLDPDAATAKAATEALQLQLLARQLDDPGSGYMTRAAGGDGPLKPWRADRRYTASYRPDLADAIDPLCNLQLYLDPALQERFDAALAERVGLAGGTAGPGPGRPTSLAGVLDRLGALGHTVYSVDVTTSDLDDADLHVVRVVVPGYTSNWPPAYPFAGGERMAALAGADGPSLDLPLPH